MNPSNVVTAAAIGLMLGAAPADAQRLAADVSIRSGPVRGRVVVADGYSTYRRVHPVAYRRAPVRHVVVVHRHAPAPRIIVVERVRHHRHLTHHKHHRHHRHCHARAWRDGGYRMITVYSDGDRYYERDVYRPGLREIAVYERDGRFYLPEDDDD